MSRKCKYWLQLIQAFACPGWMKMMKEECRGDDLIDVRMTIDDLLTIVDMVHEKREKQQKSGIRIVTGENRFDFEARCNKCGNPIAYFGTCRGFDFEEAKKRLEKIHIDHFCKYCGNQLRGEVHRT